MNDRRKRYELTIVPRREYLYARVRAETIDSKTAVAYLREVAGSCFELKRRRVILERDIPVMLPDTDLFFTTGEFIDMMKNVRIAFVNPHEAIHREMEFAILIATNRGAEFALHADLASAENWLLG